MSRPACYLERMTGVLVLRPAELAERKALEDLQRRASLVWEDSREALKAHPEAIQLPAWQIEEGRVIVAERDGALLGFAALLLRADGEGELDGLFVDPPFWRGGVGAKLTAGAEALAARDGARVLHVLANPNAIAFYRAYGFVATGTVQMQFGPAFSMQKAITLPG